MGAFEHVPSSLLAAALRPAVRGLLLLPDGALASALEAAAAVAPAAGTRALLREIAGIFRGGPPHSALVRRMLARSRPDELAEYLWGALFLERPRIGG